MKDRTFIIVGIVCAVACVVLWARMNSTRQTLKGITSRVSGLERKVTLFDSSGKPIRSWDINSTYRADGTGIDFIDKNEKFVAINGTFIVEEK